jgi:hypothetical protein
MTDILTKLAALTQKDADLLKWPCPFCGSICGSAKHDDGRFWWQCDGCHATGPLESRYSGDDDPEWNSRPRESALIALVQEAAGEIERLNKKISTLEWAIGCKDKQILEFSDAINE